MIDLFKVSLLLVSTVFGLVPGRSPTQAPSDPRALAPTVSGSGWLTENYYENTTSTTPIVVYGRRTGDCIDDPDKYGNYYKVTCGTGKSSLFFIGSRKRGFLPSS